MMAKINLRTEQPGDHKAVFDLIQSAFQSAEYSDHSEHFLVDRLRASKAFIPDLSIVAETDGIIVGHILLTKIKINDEGNSYPSLALAPVSVLPQYQGLGIGGKLIQEAHDVARRLGHTSVVLLGHKDYYPRFGYKQASTFGISLPFEVPAENCMAIELVDGALENVSGIVEYAAAFYG